MTYEFFYIYGKDMKVSTYLRVIASLMRIFMCYIYCTNTKPSVYFMMIYQHL